MDIIAYLTIGVEFDLACAILHHLFLVWYPLGGKVIQQTLTSLPAHSSRLEYISWQSEREQGVILTLTSFNLTRGPTFIPLSSVTPDLINHPEMPWGHRVLTLKAGCITRTRSRRCDCQVGMSA